MKLGLALYGPGINHDNLRFARQAGCTHIVAHFAHYGHKHAELPERYKDAYGFTGDSQLWTYEELRDLRALVNGEGLELEALENFNPGFWYDVLLDGPRKAEQIENLKQIVRNAGRAGIGTIGYAFNLPNVWGHTHGPYARGGALAAAYDNPVQPPIPLGQVWNMVYDPDAPEGFLTPPTREEMWGRLEYFLKEMLPVAEEAGVVLAAHPDDPPMPVLRGAPRLLHQPRHYDTLFELVPSPNSQAEFCVGTISEMAGGDTYDAAERYSAQGKIAYVHLRAVRGQVPQYYEVFIDEGDIDLLRVLRILHRNGFDGVVTPDHTPEMQCAAPWHAGMAYQLGYLKAAITLIEQSE
jgi:mannonate dehydratase